MFIIVLRGQRELEEVKINDFFSLKSLDLNLYSVERITLRNLMALRDLKFQLLDSPINSDIQLKLFDQMPNFQKLTLIGHFSYFNLDKIFLLPELSLKGLLYGDFNFDLFKNLCNELTDLSINCFNIDDEKMDKLFICHQFPNLSKLLIMKTGITKLENKILSRFQTLKDLTIYNNKELNFIGFNSFCNLKQLTRLNLTGNSITSFERIHFSKLTNLEYLKLSDLKIVSLRENLFSNLKNWKVPFENWLSKNVMFL